MLVAVGIPAAAGDLQSASSDGLHFAAAFVALGCAARAVISPEVDARISPFRQTTLAVLAFMLVLPVTSVLTNGASTQRAANAVIGVTFVALAVVVELRRRKATHFTWPGLAPLLAGLALAELVTASVPRSHPMHTGGAAFILFAATGVAAVRIIGDLHAAGSLHRHAAFQSHLLRHEAENASATGGGPVRRSACTKFARPSVRSKVASSAWTTNGLMTRRRPKDGRSGVALLAEIERLQALVADDDDTVGADSLQRPNRARADAHGVAGPAGGRWRGRSPTISKRQVDRLISRRSCTACLPTRHRHAPGTPIDVTARRDGAFVLVAVEDRGPGIDRARARPDLPARRASRAPRS